MFVAKNKVRIHDTDLAGLLYFPRIYRFANDALEDFLIASEINLEHFFHKENTLFVVVHSEADYYNPLRVGDHVNVHVIVENIGNTSFKLLYQIYKEDKTHMATVRIVYVYIDRKAHKKISVPAKVKQSLEKHLK